jgi:hypothetical protein
VKILPILIATALAVAQSACAQSAQKTLYLVHLSDDLPVFATSVRMISGLTEASLDETQHSLTLKGTPDQMALAEWLVKSVDVSTNGPGDPNVGAPYRVSGTDDSVRVFYLTYTSTVQETQEVATLIRTIGEIRQVAVYQPQRALMIRGTSEQLAMVDWISSQLANHKPGQSSDGAVFKLAAAPENVIRVFWTQTTSSMREFQNMATVLRSAAAIRRVFTYNKQMAIAVRDTDDQIALAAVLLRDLDQPAHATAPHATGAKDWPVVQAFFLRPTPGIDPWSDADLQKTVADVRAVGNVMIIDYAPKRAIVVRTTSDQLAATAKVLEGKLAAVAQ